MTRRKQMEVPLDPGEQRWRRHRLVGRAVGMNQVHAYNATATPLDAYRHGKLITAVQFDAGNRLRDNWIVAGKQPRLIVLMEAHGGHDNDEVGGERDRRRTRALLRVRRWLQRLEPELASCAWNVCLMEECAEYWATRFSLPGQLGLLVLIEALDGMMRKGN